MGKRSLVLLLAVVVLVSLYGCLNKTNNADIDKISGGPKDKSSEEPMDEADESGDRGEKEEMSGGVDISEWRVYQKESKNLRFRFHDDWYYARNSRKEVELEYELYVGFAEKRETLEKGAPYPVEFVILPSDKRLEYISKVSYATGTEKNDKFYLFATNNKSEYGDMVLAMAGSLKFLDEEIMAEYRDDVIVFSYPKMWGKPSRQEGGSERFSPQKKVVKWIVIPGLVDKAGCEGHDCPVFRIFGYEDQDHDKILEEIKDDSLMNVEAERIVNGNKVIVFESGGICGDLNAYIFDDKQTVEIESHCGADDDTIRQNFNKILNSFDFAVSGTGTEE